jgi:MinD superfamily P-loop ATPase
LEKVTHLEENGLRQQTHNPKVRHEQKVYQKTKKCRLFCRPEAIVETDQASFP